MCGEEVYNRTGTWGGGGGRGSNPHISSQGMYRSLRVLFDAENKLLGSNLVLN